MSWCSVPRIVKNKLITILNQENKQTNKNKIQTNFSKHKSPNSVCALGFNCDGYFAIGLQSGVHIKLWREHG